MLWLRSESPAAPGRVDLPEGHHTLGRAADCDLRFEDPRVSRHHARLEVAEGRLTVRDLGSRNGVVVNGVRVQEAVAGLGDRVAFGPLSFVVGGGPSPDDTQSLPEATGLLERGRLAADRPPADARRLRILHAMAGRLAADLDRDALLPHVLDCLQEAFPCDRCALAGPGEDGGLVSWAGRPEGTAPAFSRTVAHRVLERGEALWFDDIQGQLPFDLGESVAGLNIRSVLCSPLISRGEVQGLVYVDRSRAGAYDLEDLALLRSIAALAAVALENARLHGELRRRYDAAAQDLRTAEQRLLDAERAAALGRLALALAHEVRNPVTVIGGLARRLARGRAGCDDAEAVASILEEAERLEQMMDRVEALAGVSGADVRAASLGPAVAAAVEEARPALRRRGISLPPPEVADGAEAPHDPRLLRLALSAVLEHASRQVPAGGEVRVRVCDEESGWVVDVADARFAGAAPATVDLYGAGPAPEPWALDLGLALAERAMAAQGGEVRGSGRADTGIRVRLLLPSPDRDRAGS